MAAQLQLWQSNKAVEDSEGKALPNPAYRKLDYTRKVRPYLPGHHSGGGGRLQCTRFAQIDQTNWRLVRITNGDHFTTRWSFRNGTGSCELRSRTTIAPAMAKETGAAPTAETEETNVEKEETEDAPAEMEKMKTELKRVLSIRSDPRPDCPLSIGAAHMDQVLLWWPRRLETWAGPVTVGPYSSIVCQLRDAPRAVLHD
ncbi:hypothetical protein CRG98_006841 [Punica granatum]|uniref:Uncharacterized protein n=1 Tax=Punica granatum TaxID=22663 RepID=A0A2I0KY56_PUNGR|nr:hypothetical protein CRG98_006841 [Punica granatum]